MSPELPPMAVQYTGHMIQTETCDTAIGGSSGGVIRTIP